MFDLFLYFVGSDINHACPTCELTRLFKDTAMEICLSPSPLISPWQSSPYLPRISLWRSTFSHHFHKAMINLRRFVMQITMSQNLHCVFGVQLLDCKYLFHILNSLTFHHCIYTCIFVIKYK